MALDGHRSNAVPYDWCMHSVVTETPHRETPGQPTSVGLDLDECVALTARAVGADIENSGNAVTMKCTDQVRHAITGT